MQKLRKSSFRPINLEAKNCTFHLLISTTLLENYYFWSESWVFSIFFVFFVWPNFWMSWWQSFWKDYQRVKKSKREELADFSVWFFASFHLTISALLELSSGTQLHPVFLYSFVGGSSTSTEWPISSGLWFWKAINNPKLKVLN